LLRRTIFVSFNYDLILERSIQALNPKYWNAISGYGFDCSGYFSMATGKVIKEQEIKKDRENLILLKPHGSLAWLKEQDVVYPIVDDRVAGTPQFPLDDASLKEIFARKEHESAIIPPGRIKRMAGRHSWETWKVLQNALEREAKKVAVIGWNVPDTDSDVRNRINRFIDQREEDNIIETLVVCDKKKEDSFVDRMSMVFTPAKVEPLSDGFGDGVTAIVKALAG
jgi:hypothetical protein